MLEDECRVMIGALKAKYFSQCIIPGELTQIFNHMRRSRAVLSFDDKADMSSEQWFVDTS